MLICIRVSGTSGIPPPVVPDTYSREHSGKTAESLLPVRVVFEKQLSAVHTDCIVQLERLGLATRPDKRASVLNPLIDTASENLQEFDLRCPGDMGEFLTCRHKSMADDKRIVLFAGSQVAGRMLPPLRPARSH